MSDPLRVGTRSSALALRQAGMVQEALRRAGVDSELVRFKTLGDKRLDQSLSAIGGKGLFTRELERALARGKVDLCVHSLKDLPTEMPDGLVLAALLEREDPRDVLVVNGMIAAESLAELPPGTRVGTSSLRRRAQLLSARPDLAVGELRGNVPTRLRKVDDGVVHAAVLAAAGLHRLDARQHIRCYLEPPTWLPAAGQGIIAVQLREENAELRGLLGGLNHRATEVAATAERAFLEAMDGGCQVPIGALAVEETGGVRLHGLIADPDGSRTVRGELMLSPGSAREGGVELARRLRKEGGESILQKLRELTSAPRPQPE